jgi:hypothetical protein
MMSDDETNLSKHYFLNKNPIARAPSKDIVTLCFLNMFEMKFWIFAMYPESF